MIKTYDFDYDMYEAEARFTVDTEKFTPEMATATLDFFSWDTPPDPEGDPVDEVMKKYAMQAIMIATEGNWNEEGVIHQFEKLEGYGRIDGSIGITLVSISGYEFQDEKLSMTVTEKRS